MSLPGFATRRVTDLRITTGRTDRLQVQLSGTVEQTVEVVARTAVVELEEPGGNPNVHGGRERDFRAQIGGVSNVDPLTGEWLSRINSESIEEMEILPWGAGVEFGRASAAFARVLQTQGSNEFECAFSRKVQLQPSGEVFNLLNDDRQIIEDRINSLMGGVRRFGRRWQLGMRVGF